ncbi:hypothetical protein AAG570_010782 [Ranatra chinensis]|uniref:PH domain-containing protein n=1 Tax=Ranatra chinensis TaxID=642074 RepID=A0ABD0YNH4_9HEMI
MKINEKNLAAFATSATPVDREGWLVKRGEVNKAFQKRWFVLKGNLLFYFEKRGDREPLGVVVLEGCTIELAEDEDQFAFKIVFHGQGNRSYILEADSQESMEQWMKALACASYDYMKLMVTELQRQLDEMENNVPVAVPLVGNDSGVLGCEPRPPPRSRHNPFNRAGPHLHNNIRSHITRSAPATTLHDRQKITFRELHTMYGRPILRDLNEWRHQQRQLQQPLIIL